MDIFFEDVYRRDSRDMDLFGYRRPSAVLGILQEAATQGAAAIHLSREETMKRYHAVWMISRIRYQLKRPLFWDEPVTVKTWHRGGKAAASYREFDLSVEGERVGEALSLWVLVDLDTHKLVRLADIGEFGETSGGSLCRSDTLHRFRLPPDMVPAEVRRLHYSDTDMNGHVNNVKYADFACDALHLEELGKGKFVSSLQLSYLAECMAGEELTVCVGQDGQNYYVSGEDTQKKERFNAWVTLDNLPKKA